MFDKYKINSVVVKFRATTNPDASTNVNSNTVNANSVYQDIYCTLDQNDTTTPLSVHQLLQYGSIKMGIFQAN